MADFDKIPEVVNTTRSKLSYLKRSAHYNYDDTEIVMSSHKSSSMWCEVKLTGEIAKPSFTGVRIVPAMDIKLSDISLAPFIIVCGCAVPQAYLISKVTDVNQNNIFRKLSNSHAQRLYSHYYVTHPNERQKMFDNIISDDWAINPGVLSEYRRAINLYSTPTLTRLSYHKQRVEGLSLNCIGSPPDALSSLLG